MWRGCHLAFASAWPRGERKKAATPAAIDSKISSSVKRRCGAGLASLREAGESIFVSSPMAKMASR